MLSVPWYFIKHHKKGKASLRRSAQHNRAVFVGGSFSENGFPGVGCADEETFCISSGKTKIYNAVSV